MIHALKIRTSGLERFMIKSVATSYFEFCSVYKIRLVRRRNQRIHRFPFIDNVLLKTPIVQLIIIKNFNSSPNTKYIKLFDMHLNIMNVICNNFASYIYVLGAEVKKYCPYIKKGEFVNIWTT